ncbi:MAG: glycosyltransferase family 1 protein [Deltaproteobacteria bacterium]|nr:glycosyltransferase family 1 protein [Deltaproteobacteria bacterium]
MTNITPPKRILFVMLEFHRWERAKAWWYGGVFGFEQAFLDNGVEVTLLPYFDKYERLPPGWVDFAKRAVGQKKFDQVWLYLLHTEYEPKLANWLKSVAPIRVGMIPESLEYEAAEIHETPVLANYKNMAITQAKQMELTHAMVVDECDISCLNEIGIKAMYFPLFVPAAYINQKPIPTPIPKMLMPASIYGAERRALVADPSLKNLLERGPLPDQLSPYPALFDRLNEILFSSYQFMEEPEVDAYISNLRRVREEIFKLFMAGMQQWAAILNPPAYTKCFPSRVVEAMATGRVVLTPEISDAKPITKRLFTPNQDILFYQRGDLSQIRTHVERLINDQAFARQIGESACAKLLKFHTSENRVRQALEFIDSGTTPVFY